ncbi:MAG TPA: sigma factor, partial [Chloroflexota bacterium]|nr:sigma factor [Chloroflexota bacterium]
MATSRLEAPVIEPLLAARERFLAFVRSRISDPDLAEDILQESLLKAVRAAPAVDDDQRLAAWFYRVLQNAIVDAYRRRAAETARGAPLDGAAV